MVSLTKSQTTTRDTARPHPRGAPTRPSGRARRRRDRRGSGRALGEAFSQFGHSAPVLPDPTPERAETATDEGVEFPLWEHSRGVFRPGMGWSTTKEPPVRVYRATTNQVGGVFPLLTAQSLPKSGALMGRDRQTGTGFHADPIGWVLSDLISNPNIIIMGKPGMGKSTTSKALCWRWMRYGAKVLIAGDLKDEYTKLCHAMGQDPIALGIGMPARINPLDAGPLGFGWARLSEDERRARFADMRSRWLVLLAALLGSQGVQVTTSVEQALAAAVDDLVGASRSSLPVTPTVTIPMVWEALRDPSEELVRECRYRDAQHMRDQLRPAIDGLGGLCRGVLRGLFDQETTVNIDWQAPIQSLSLRRLKSMGDEAVAVALTCVNSWSRGMTDIESAGDIRFVVRDEVWRQMRLGVNAVKSLDSDLRLSRDERQVQMILMHKPSDLGSVGDAGSQEYAIAKDLWALCDTKILLAQEEQIAKDLAAQLGLSSQEAAAIYRWAWGQKGRALWRVGDMPFRVETIQTEAEKALFDTQEQLMSRTTGEDQ